jgi:hypothetical protein
MTTSGFLPRSRGRSCGDLPLDAVGVLELVDDGDAVSAPQRFDERAASGRRSASATSCSMSSKS